MSRRISQRWTKVSGLRVVSKLREIEDAYNAILFYFTTAWICKSLIFRSYFTNSSIWRAVSDDVKQGRWLRQGIKGALRAFRTSTLWLILSRQRTNKQPCHIQQVFPSETWFCLFILYLREERCTCVRGGSLQRCHPGEPAKDAS
jgi:hypothetical protein